MAIKAIFQELEHRPWAIPRGRWVIAQQWHDLLFAHWPISLQVLKAHVPAGLEIDTYHGQGWIGIVPFLMSRVRLRYLPAVPGTSEFPELNLRTYVTRDGKPGVWFFSLDAANSLAVAVARAWFHLPYFRARMRCEDESGWIAYESKRNHEGAATAVFRGRYRGVGNTFRAKAGSLEHFLVERYCLYSRNPNGQLFRAEIHHPQWYLQQAEAEIVDNSVANGLIEPLRGKPLLHLSRGQDVVAWAPRPI